MALVRDHRAGDMGRGRASAEAGHQPCLGGVCAHMVGGGFHASDAMDVSGKSGAALLAAESVLGAPGRRAERVGLLGSLRRIEKRGQGVGRHPVYGAVSHGRSGRCPGHFARIARRSPDRGNSVRIGSGFLTFRLIGSAWVNERVSDFEVE